jgi:hypothetical protein
MQNLDQTGLPDRINTSVKAIYQGKEWLDTEGLEGKGRISFKGGFALDVLKNADIYKSVEKTYSHRKEFRYKKMPKDAFHVACAGHTVRLENNGWPGWDCSSVTAHRLQPFSRHFQVQALYP